MQSSQPIQHTVTQPLLSLHRISKRFGKTVANDDVSLEIFPHQIHALLGENGAGKSTLVSILYGLLQPDSGSITIDQNETKIKHPQDAIQQGIAMVHQHMALIQDFTVLENLMLGQEHTGPFGLNTKQSLEFFQSLAVQYRLPLPMHDKICDLPVGIQQRVEIVKALSRKPRIIIFDEPTAALVTHEIDAFLKTMMLLRDQGMAVIFITHRMNEVLRVADRVSVLRQGRVVYQKQRDEFNQDEIAHAIVGERSASETYSLPKTGSPVCRIEKLCAQGHPHLDDVNLNLQQSEIIGIAGVAGNGQDTLIQTILGKTKTKSGMIYLNDVPIQSLSIAQRKNAGIALIPQDRRRHGLVAEFSLWENILLNRNTSNMQSKMVLRSSTVQSKTNALIQDYSVKTSSFKQNASSLSGGHQQRLIIARELAAKPKLIIAYDPTRGLDIRASRFVHEQLIQAATAGAAVLLFSSELSELFLLCHQIGVINRGKLSAIRPATEWTQESISIAMTGDSA